MDGNYATVISEASHLLAQSVLAQEKALTSRAQTIDGDLKEFCRQIGLGAAAEILGELSNRVTTETIAAGIDVNRRSSITYSVVFGQVKVEAPYHWNRETRKSARPVLTKLGLKHQGRSVAVERALSDFGNEESFARAGERFEEHYGWEVGRTTILRVVERRAREAEAYVEERLDRAEAEYQQPLLSRPGVQDLLVEMDGCEIRTGTLVPARNRERTAVRKRPRRKRNEAWREVRVGLAGPLEAPEQRTYVARMDEYPAVVRQLFSAGCDQGLSSTTQVTAVADGGNGLREELDAQFVGERFVLDRCHLKGHLYETTEAQGFRDDERERRVSDLMARIDSGKARDVLAEFRAYKGHGRKRVRRLIKYLVRFIDAVHYDAFRELGLPIGSGEVESCHRWLPQKRLKLPGTWWHPDTVNPMLALRVIRANGWWQDFWRDRARLAAA